METMVMGVVSRLVIYFVVFASGQYGQTAIRLASAVPSPAASVVEPLWMVGVFRSVDRRYYVFFPEQSTPLNYIGFGSGATCNSHSELIHNISDKPNPISLDALTRVFPVRTCSNSFFDQRARARRPCLYYDIGRCSGPCVPEQTGVTEESYRADVDALGEFLSGHERPIMERLEREMEEAARRQEYELAAKHRDQLTAARRALESQEMVLSREAA